MRVPEIPTKRHAKHVAWNAGLYLTPFAFALFLLKWGSLLPAWLVITFTGAVILLFVLAGYLHVRDIGFRKNFHEHPALYVIGIVLCCCTALGTGMYLAMRPAGDQVHHFVRNSPLPQELAQEPAGLTAQPAKPIDRKAPRIPSSEADPKVPVPVPLPASRSSAQAVPRPDITPPSTSVQQPSYQQQCVGSACAQGQGAQATFNQYGAPKLLMTDVQRDAIRDAMKPFAGMAVWATSHDSTEDSGAFAEQFIKAIRDANMNGTLGYGTQFGPVSSGITITTAEDGLKAATALKESLYPTGVRVEIIHDARITGRLNVVIAPNR